MPESMRRIPTVSVIIPCRNEEAHIETSVNSILAQDYSIAEFEVIVVDGISEDGTRGIVTKIADHVSNFRLIDNSSRNTPCAMNRGIETARGRYVAILGAHTEYGCDYLRTCVNLLDEHMEASCVGGPILSKGIGLFGRAVALVMAHPIGVGNAKHRYPTYEGYAQGACYPMFRKEVFEKIGLYDEQLLRNQDDELNYRLAKHGEKVFISPRARCTYFVRETPSPAIPTIFPIRLLAGIRGKKAWASDLHSRGRAAALYVIHAGGCDRGIIVAGVVAAHSGYVALGVRSDVTGCRSGQRRQSGLACCAPIPCGGRDHACGLRCGVYVRHSERQKAERPGRRVVEGRSLGSQYMMSHSF